MAQGRKWEGHRWWVKRRSNDLAQVRTERESKWMEEEVEGDEEEMERWRETGCKIGKKGEEFLVFLGLKE